MFNSPEILTFLCDLTYCPLSRKTRLQPELSDRRFCLRQARTAKSPSAMNLRQSRETSPEQTCCSDGLPPLAGLVVAPTPQSRIEAKAAHMKYLGITDLKLNWSTGISRQSGRRLM
jgi:hypothetical protein